jgi:competence protein ComEA
MKKSKRFIALLVFAVFLISMVPIAMAADSEKININTATAEQLIKLKRIGPKYAERIIQYRETNGKFKSVEDIIAVKGIGQKTVEANIDVMTVE